MEQKFNVDIAGAVSELEILLKAVLPKNIIWKIVLGKGLEFDGYRDYSIDDDASNIDWKASVRGKKLLVKQFIEERDKKFMFIVDVSDNMIFGSTEKLKCEYTAEMVSSLSHLILMTGDRVGFTLFNDRIVKFRPPDVGNRQFETIVYEIANPENYGGPSDLNSVLDTLIKTIDKSVSMVFLVSDFVRVEEDYRKNLEILSALFETVAIIVRDPLDNSLPEINKEIVIEDAGTKEKILINPKVAKNLYEKHAHKQLSFVKQMFKDFNIDFIELSTDESSALGIAEFLKERIGGGRFSKKNVPQF